jgi:hypothetical protein
VSVEAADRDDRPLPAELVPRAQVAFRRMVHVAVRRDEELDDVAPPVDRLAGVVHEAPQLEPREAVEVAEGDPAPLEEPRPLGEGMRSEAEPALSFDRLTDLLRGLPALLDHPVDPEGEVVVLVRRDLLADQQQHVVVPALLPVISRRQRVVVGEQHDVDAGLRRGSHDLRHRAGPIGPGRVDVDDASQIAHVASMTLWQ